MVKTELKSSRSSRWERVVGEEERAVGTSSCSMVVMSDIAECDTPLKVFTALLSITVSSWGTIHNTQAELRVTREA